MQATANPEVGQLAPDFKLKGPGGQPVTLSEFRGHNAVVLVFFPLAFSGICSHQLPSIEKLAPRLAEINARILGISVDSHYANTEFAQEAQAVVPAALGLQARGQHRVRRAASRVGVQRPRAVRGGQAGAHRLSRRESRITTIPRRCRTTSA